jgi:hypothetical protein
MAPKKLGDGKANAKTVNKKTENEKTGHETRSAAAPSRRPARSKIAFPKKSSPPSETEFAARLPLGAGKRLEMVRGFLKKQKGVTEELYYYGPKTGWAFRYLRNLQQSICSIMLHDERLLGILSMDTASRAAVGWAELSPVGQKAKKLAHGSPALLWIDVPLDGSGAADFKALLKAKLKAVPLLPPPPPRAPAARR